jgi:hypothetical protein
MITLLVVAVKGECRFLYRNSNLGSLAHIQSLALSCCVWNRKWRRFTHIGYICSTQYTSISCQLLDLPIIQSLLIEGNRFSDWTWLNIRSKARLHCACGLNRPLHVLWSSLFAIKWIVQRSVTVATPTPRGWLVAHCPLAVQGVRDRVISVTSVRVVFFNQWDASHWGTWRSAGCDVRSLK